MFSDSDYERAKSIVSRELQALSAALSQAKSKDSEYRSRLGFKNNFTEYWDTLNQTGKEADLKAFLESILFADQFYQSKPKMGSFRKLIQELSIDLQNNRMLTHFSAVKTIVFALNIKILAPLVPHFCDYKTKSYSKTRKQQSRNQVQGICVPPSIFKFQSPHLMQGYYPNIPVQVQTHETDYYHSFSFNNQLQRQQQQSHELDASHPESDQQTYQNSTSIIDEEHSDVFQGITQPDEQNQYKAQTPVQSSLEEEDSAKNVYQIENPEIEESIHFNEAPQTQPSQYNLDFESSLNDNYFYSLDDDNNLFNDDLLW